MAQKKESKRNKEGGTLESTIENIKTKFGDEAIMKLGDRPKVDVDAISTGSIGLDFVLGVNGLPRGRIIEVYGPESSGKTTLCLHVVAEAQKKGGVAAFVDTEHALDPEYSKRLGVKTSDLLISQPDTGEQALEIVESLVRSCNVDVVVIDSVAALTPRDEIEGEMGAQHVGKQARLMSQALRKLTAITARSNTMVIFTNQIRMKIGVMFGCFSYDSKVLLSNGKKEKIGKLVNQQKETSVLSYNFEKKCVEPKPITDWHVNGKTESFLQFFVQNHTENGRRGFSCTENHKVYTPKGWKEAQELKVGDEISVHIDNCEITPQQEEIIIGSLLGDGNIKRQGEQTAYFREEHGPKQTEYISWLANELGDVTRNVSLKTKRGTAVLETKASLRIGDIHGLFYENKKKIVPESIVERITPRAIALWYCGDGSLQAGTSKWKGKSYERRPRAALYVNAFDDTESRERITRIFSRFNINPSWYQHGPHRAIMFSVKEAPKFFELIAPFVPKSMEYKLPKEYRGLYHKEPSTFSQPSSEVLRPMKIKEIRTRTPYKDGDRISKNRFDISVADNHNYFVDGCLVSNSPETQPGGKALKFYSSVRLDIRRIAQIKKGDEVMGGRVRVKVVKNKVASPFGQTEFDLMYNEGISREGEILALGEKYGVIQKSGASYSYGEEKLGRGYDATRNYLRENRKVANTILKEIKTKLKESKKER